MNVIQPSLGGYAVPIVNAGMQAMGMSVDDFKVPYAATVPLPRSRSGSRQSRRSRSRSNASSRSSRSSTNVKLKSDGTSATAKTIKKRKRGGKKKKTTIKQQLKKVRKLIPKQSHKLFRDFKTYCMLETVPNTVNVYAIDVFTKSDLDSYASTLTAVDSSATADYTTENTSLKMDRYFKLHCKNAVTGNVSISYCFYVCKETDAAGPLTRIKEELDDRGYANVQAPNNAEDANATRSERPPWLSLNGGIAEPSKEPFHAPIFGGASLNAAWRPWKKGVCSAVIGPGATMDLIWSQRGFTYKQEKLDQESDQARIKGYSVKLLIRLQGDLCHDQTNTRLVGYGLYQIDAEAQVQCKVTYPNPKGLNEVDYTNTLTNTNFTVPVAADNQISAVEIQDK